MLGCESIRYSELEVLKRDLAPLAIVLYETLTPDPGRFTDPLAYVFLAPIAGNSTEQKTVILVQFKTRTMGGDVDHSKSMGYSWGISSTSLVATHKAYGLYRSFARMRSPSMMRITRQPSITNPLLFTFSSIGTRVTRCIEGTATDYLAITVM